MGDDDADTVEGEAEEAAYFDAPVCLGCGVTKGRKHGPNCGRRDSRARSLSTRRGRPEGVVTPLLDDSPEGRQFARFCRAFLRQSKGRWAGRPLELETWQHRVIATMLERVPTRVVGDDGVARMLMRRRYTEALLGLPRKNGKSTISSAIALYFLILEGTLYDHGAEVYAAAASKDQAKIVFSEAKRMVLSSPHLKDACQVYRDAVVVKDTGAVFRVLSADGRLQHGLNPSCVIIDELHAHRDPELYYALRTGSGAREEPLIISITTAGHDLGTVCGDLYLRGMKGEDPRLFFHWLGVADDELDDHDAWAAANPASWITKEWLVEQSRSIPQAVFHRLHLNRWTRAEQLWLPKGAQAACVTDEVRLHDGDLVDLGVDMGRKHDTAAVAIVGPLDEATGQRPSRG
jgi:phage terminase large subunit-like protein